MGNISLEDMINNAKKGASKSKPEKSEMSEDKLIKELKEITPDSPHPRQKRRKKITLMCDDVEATKIKANAAEMRLSLSDFIRQSTVNNLLMERRSNDIRDSSLDLVGQLRCELTAALTGLQAIIRDMDPGAQRDALVSIARAISRGQERLDNKEKELCS